MGMLYEYDDKDRKIIDPSSQFDSIQQPCVWLALPMSNDEFRALLNEILLKDETTK